MSEKVTQFGFNATEVAPSVPYEIIPDGWYLGKIVEAEVMDTKDGTGKRIPVKIEIVEGSFEGRFVFDNINIENQNPKAEQIGRATLSAICHAVGELVLQDLEQLLEKPLFVKVKTDKEREGEDGKVYEAKNVIKGYQSASEPPKGYAGGMATTTPANPSGRPPAPGGSKPPAAPKAASAPPKAPTPPKPAAAAPTQPPAPKPAAPKAPPAPPKVDRMFYIVVNEETVEKYESEIAALIEAKEVAIADPCMLSTESEWKTVGDYSIGVAPKPAAPAGPKAPPWKKK